MATIPLQKAIEQARANPNSEFATKLRQSIESGNLDEAAIKQGVDLTKFGRNITTQTPEGGLFSETARDIKQFGSDFKQSAERRMSNMGETRQALQSGEIKDPEAIFQTIGQVAGLGADQIGNLFKLGVKAILPQKAEEATKQVVENLGEKVIEIPEVQSAINWYSNLDENQKRNVDAVGGIVSLASEFVGAGAGKRGIQATKNVIGNTAEEAVNRISKSVGSQIDNVKSVKNVFSQTAKEVGAEFSPSQIADRVFVKGFKLAPGDVSDVEGILKSSVSDWAVSNNLVGKNGKETVEKITKFKFDNYNAVRDAVGAVDETFSFKDVPEAENIIDRIIDRTEGLGSVEYRGVNNQLKNIAEKLNSGGASLSDIQFVKSTFDDIESIFKRSGQTDFKEGVKFADLGSSRKSVQTFIEDRVAEKLPNVDIRELNRNVAASKTLVDDIIKRSAKFDTASSVSIGDYFVFGLGQQAVPGAGIATLGIKKVVESTPIRMLLTKALAKKTVKPTDIKKIQQEIAAEIEAQLGNITP